MLVAADPLRTGGNCLAVFAEIASRRVVGSRRDRAGPMRAGHEQSGPTHVKREKSGAGEDEAGDRVAHRNAGLLLHRSAE